MSKFTVKIEMGIFFINNSFEEDCRKKSYEFKRYMKTCYQNLYFDDEIGESIIYIILESLHVF